MNIEQKISCCKLGAYSAIVAGFCFLIISILAFQMPASIASYIASDTYFKDFLSINHLFQSLKILMTTANIAMIGVVCSFLALCREKNIGLMLWVSILACLGFGFGILQNIVDMSVIPKLTEYYFSETSIIKDIIIVFGVSNPKMFILTLGLPGVWFIVVSALGKSNNLIPRYLIYLGFLWGVGNILTAIAHAFIIIPLIYLIAVGALIIAPIWGLCEGFYLLKVANSLSETAPVTTSKNRPSL